LLVPEGRFVIGQDALPEAELPMRNDAASCFAVSDRDGFHRAARQVGTGLCLCVGGGSTGARCCDGLTPSVSTADWT
jgi:hypothetical protein